MSEGYTVNAEIFERLESDCGAYRRSWPAIFTAAAGHSLWDDRDREYIDFCCGSGFLNYGHNDPRLQRALLAYIAGEGVIHALDMATAAKQAFLERFESVILQPRALDYRVRFTGPAGTNAVEAALGIARRATGRTTVISFTNAFHGLTLGSLAVSGDQRRRSDAVSLHSDVMPYEGFLGSEVDTIAYLETYLGAKGSGVDRPAAIIVETVQGGGGLHTASAEWLQRLADLYHRHEILLIVDDIQTGCGRAGTFFSFEHAGIQPDLVTISSAISGYGLPMALTLLRRDLDPGGGSHATGEPQGGSGFRGNNAAFVTAAEALTYWESDDLARAVAEKSAQIESFLDCLVTRYPEAAYARRGRGMMQGLHCAEDGLAEAASREAFERGLIVERSGADHDVVKVTPPLTIPDEALAQGLQLLEESLLAVTRRSGRTDDALLAAGS